MALITCPNCGKLVSDKAVKCPHCSLDLTVSNTQTIPHTTTEQVHQSLQVEEVQNKPRKIWLAFVAGVVCMSMVMAALWIFVFDDKNVEEQTPIIVEKEVEDVQQYSEPKNNNNSKTTFEHLMNKNAASYSFTENDLSSLSPKELSYLRNHIYAVHGYVFKSQELTDYFSQFSWYLPNPEVTGEELNNTEKANADFIKRYQNENGKNYQLDSK